MATNLKDNNQTVNDDDLSTVASELVSEWKDVGRRLGLTEADFDNIRENYHGNQKEMKYQMLLTWKKRNGSCATYNILADALDKEGRRDVLQKIPRLDKNHILFIKELKKVYKRKFFNVRHIPNDDSLEYCVNDIYTESGMRIKNKKKSTKDPTCWTNLDSRHKLLQSTPEGTIVIEGEPGYGKSILLTQYAYDWYSSTEDSPLTKDGTIFILLRLREVKTSSSIFETIKLLLLNDLSLSCNEIKDIITSQNWKVVFAFDGYDEFMVRDSADVDVFKIIQGRMLSSCLVIVSTRPVCLPNLQSSTEIRCQLTGFNRRIQNTYIEKVIIPYAEGRDMKTLITQKLQENGVLSDICEVPLFFVIFAHMKYTNHDELNIETVTGYFKYILDYFRIHSERKETDETKSRCTGQEDPHYQRLLSDFAFEGLRHQNFVWEKEEMMRLIDLHCYEYYIKAGIILEEHCTGYKVRPGSHMDDKVLDEIHVRFFHKTFQEYYAAVHFVHLVSDEHSFDVSSILSKFYEDEIQYFFRFASGLRPIAGGIVQKYLSGLPDGKILSILCCKEQELQDIGNIVRELCKWTMKIDWDDNRILISAKIDVLKIASQQKSPIEEVALCDCFSSVDLMNESLCIFSDVKLPRLDTLCELDIYHEFFTDLRDEANAILDFSSRCEVLTTLKFSTLTFVLLPQSFDEDHVLAKLRSRDAEVKWFDFCMFRCRLNLQTGKWTTSWEREMTDSEYWYLAKRYLDPPEADD